MAGLQDYAQQKVGVVACNASFAGVGPDIQSVSSMDAKDLAYPAHASMPAGPRGGELGSRL